VDDVLARLQPELHVRLQDERDPALRIRFANLDDFHPDRLYERLPVFEGARELRRRLTEPGQVPVADSSAVRAGKPPVMTESLLDQIVQQAPGAADEPSPLQGGDLQAYLNRVVAPYLVPAADPRRHALIAKLDAATSSGMRALLHLPEFQALEALWRGVSLLTQQIESDATVQLYLVDVSKAELAADLDVSSIVAVPPARAPQAGWGVLGGMYSFAPGTADLELLSRLGAVGQLVSAPWIAAADSRLVGYAAIQRTAEPPEEEPTPQWQVLRHSPQASWIGLALPRFLLRAPYGEQASRCDALPFEELAAGPGHEAYLWGNPTIACLLLLTQAVAEGGRPIYPGMNLELDGLPIVSTPGIEAPLSEGAAERVLNGGVMPLVSFRDTGRVRLVRFQSIAEPSRRLAGKWLGG
jgi:type VI secretion system protein ImpC